MQIHYLCNLICILSSILCLTVCKSSKYIAQQCQGISAATFPFLLLATLRSYPWLRQFCGPLSLINEAQRSRTWGPALMAGCPEAWHEERERGFEAYLSHLRVLKQKDFQADWVWGLAFPWNVKMLQLCCNISTWLSNRKAVIGSLLLLNFIGFTSILNRLYVKGENSRKSRSIGEILVYCILTYMSTAVIFFCALMFWHLTDGCDYSHHQWIINIMRRKATCLTRCEIFQKSQIAAKLNYFCPHWRENLIPSVQINQDIFSS